MTKSSKIAAAFHVLCETTDRISICSPIIVYKTGMAQGPSENFRARKAGMQDVGKVPAMHYTVRTTQHLFPPFPVFSNFVLPLNSGHILQIVIVPSDANCPKAISMNMIGKPTANKAKQYGIRKAPAKDNNELFSSDRQQVLPKQGAHWSRTNKTIQHKKWKQSCHDKFSTHEDLQ